MENFYYDSFIKMLKNLNENQNVNVLKSEIQYILDPFQVNEVSEFINFKLDLTIIEFYTSIQKIQCYWMLKENSEKIVYLDKEKDIVGGEVNILTQKEITCGVNGKKGKELLDPFKIMDKICIDDLERFLPFDYCTSEFAVCFRHELNLIKDNLFLIDFNVGPAPIDLNINVKEYFEIGIKNMFFFGWQRAVFLADGKIAEKMYSYLKQLKNIDN